MSPSRKAPPSAVVGLDIGTDSIKVAEAKYGKDGITITGLGIGRTPEGAIENEVIVDPKALGAAIKSLLAESGIKTKQVVSSVAGQSRVVVRVIEVPKMNRTELAETMKWEVERHVPFAPTDVVMDFQPLDKPNTDPDAQNMEVLLAVAQQELISSHVETLLAAGLKPVAIDIEPLAMSRSVIETAINGAKSQVAAIVNIGSNNTDLGIFEEGVLTFPSPPLSIAGMSFTREISESLGQTLEEAETTKKEYAAVHLEAFQAAPSADDGAATSSEPTSYDTSFSSVFDVGEPADAAPVAGAQPDAAAEPANPSDFQTTIDGPVFEDPSGGGLPAFDLGEPAAPAAPASPAFDLGDDQPAAPPAAEPAAPAAQGYDFGGAMPAFDLGGAEPAFDLGGSDEPAAPAAPAAPAFDLDDAEPASEEPEGPMTPSFDLSDTDENADPGDQAEVVVPQPKPVPAGGVEEGVFNAISGVLVDLANELRRSIDYYNTRYSRMPERMFICGGTAKIPHLDQFLSEQLGIPVEVADPVKNLKVKVTGISDRYVHDVAPMFSVCVGLAIRDMVG